MNGVMNNQLERYGGDTAVTAMGIVFALSNLVYLTLLGIGMGIQPIIGYNVGARLYARVRRAAVLAIGVATVFATLCFLAVQIFPSAFVALFAGRSLDVRAIGIYALRHYFLFLPLVGFQVIGSGYFQAAGKPAEAIVLGLSRQFILLVPLLYILPLFAGLDGVWNAQPVADVLAFALTAVLFVREMRALSIRERSSSAEDAQTR